MPSHSVLILIKHSFIDDFACLMKENYKLSLPQLVHTMSLFICNYHEDLGKKNTISEYVEVFQRYSIFAWNNEIACDRHCMTISHLYLLKNTEELVNYDTP